MNRRPCPPDCPHCEERAEQAKFDREHATDPRAADFVAADAFYGRWS